MSNTMHSYRDSDSFVEKEIANDSPEEDQVPMSRILIAEDEDSLATLYKVLLSRFGYQVVEVVRSGDEVVERYKETKPNIVIMDHRLERKTGLDALKEILKIDPNAKVIFASADDSIMEDAIAAGAIDYIGKPFSLQELVEVINRCIT